MLYCSKIIFNWYFLEIRPSKLGNLARPQLGRWVGAVSLSGELLCCGGGPKAALYHLRTLSPIDPDGLQLPASTENGGLHVIEIFSEENRILLGGEMGKLYQTNLSGGLIAEIDTSSSCLYSVVYMCSESLKLMSCAGSSSKIDLCTANFSYRDRTVTFPTHLWIRCFLLYNSRLFFGSEANYNNYEYSWKI